MATDQNLKQAIESFTKISEESWDSIASAFNARDVKKGDILLREGQTCQFVAFIVKGIVREFFYHDGMDTTSHFVFQGGFFSAYSSFINQEPSKVYLEALADTQLLAMDYQTKQKLFDTVPEWERLARKITEQHYAEQAKRTRMLATMTAKEKYHELLQNGNKDIIQNIPLKHIASYLGIAPETLSRIRK